VAIDGGAMLFTALVVTVAALVAVSLATLGDGVWQAFLDSMNFTQVVVLDYSCADEAVAKLIQRFQPSDRPAEAYFLAHGVAEQHREPLEEVLIRRGLVLVADVAGVGYTLLGAPSLVEQLCWAALQASGTATLGDVARAVQHAEAEVASALESLAYRRAVIPADASGTYYALSALLS